VRRERQKIDDLLESLSAVETDWLEEHATAVLALIATIPDRATCTTDDVIDLLQPDFQVGETIIRLVLGLISRRYLAGRQTARNVRRRFNRARQRRADPCVLEG
jgi:hypothetical protein